MEINLQEPFSEGDIHPVQVSVVGPVTLHSEFYVLSSVDAGAAAESLR